MTKELSLARAKAAYVEAPSPENAARFSGAFERACSSGEWVLIPAGDGNAPVTVRFRDRSYIPVFSRRAEVRMNGASQLICTDINKTLELLERVPSLAGLAFDPYTRPLLLDRAEIAASLYGYGN